jgi:hypothetical protein
MPISDDWKNPRRRGMSDLLVGGPFSVNYDASQDDF